MTAAFLQAELTSLIADSKKRSTDVRTAAEKSLADLKSITVTSEVQLAADLSRRPHFVDPFVLACQSRNAKLANSAATCMQRLVASRAIAKERLEDVLSGFKDVVNVSYEVQLKILQTLPAILQLYPSEVRGQLLARTLEICATLEASKTSLVSSSARSTFEQLVEAVFERARVDVDGSPAHTRKASTDSLSTLADDASRIFEDLCSILNGSESTFLHVQQSSPLFILETIGTIIDGNSTYLKAKPYLIEACRAQLLPALTNLLDAKDDFYMIVQILRISLIILQRLPSLLLPDLKDLLSAFVTFLDRDGGPMWKRVLGLEFFSHVCSNFALVMLVVSSSANEGSNIIVTLMATLVRIASEDATLIGLGRQSTVPVHGGNDGREAEMASLDAQGVGGGLASVDSADASVTGISLDFSTLEKKLLDDEESDATTQIPKTYIYALALECISSFCEGLSKFIMPLSVSSKHLETSDVMTEDDGEEELPEGDTTKATPRNKSKPGHKYQRLNNPLKMSTLPQLPQVIACSTMIDQCWPAVLATCSTFLNAALDSHFYHVLIRSMQKLAQVSGTLELGTPRDALLTSLAKGSVPPNAAAIISQSQMDPEEDSHTGDTNGVRSPILETPRSPAQPRQSLNVRHLLCLRALLNLGIALGPTLVQQSWFIVIETLQQVETLMSIAGMTSGFSSIVSAKGEAGSETQTSLAGEMTAVNAASKRMFESTRAYSDGSFAAVVQALLRMTGDLQIPDNETRAAEVLKSPSNLMSPTVSKRSHHASRSVSGLWTKTKALDTEVAFVLTRIQELARVNLYRFAVASSNACTWDLIVPQLLSISKSSDIQRDLRLKSASIVDLVAIEVIKMLGKVDLSENEINDLQCKCLEVLSNQVRPSSWSSEPPQQEQAAREELQRRVFESLEDILGHSGESFRGAWRIVFDILSAGVGRDQSSIDRIAVEQNSEPFSSAVTPIAFRCAELICNDFLQMLGPESLARLIQLLYLFGAQMEDLNMSLTTASLLRNICSLLQGNTEVIDLTQSNFQSQTLVAAPTTTPERQSGHLWAMTLSQLKKMCNDRRVEVRDASMRILVQVLESTGDLLSPSSLGVALEECIFTTLEIYQHQVSKDPASTYSSSLAKVIEALTNLISQSIRYVLADSGFEHTWSRLLEVFNSIVYNSTSKIRALVFESLAKLLKALYEVSEDSARYVAPVLELWAAHGPPEEGEELGPNQSLLAAHVRLFVQGHSTAPETTASFSFEDKTAAEHAMRSVQKALLTAWHPQYTSDIRKRTVEQDAALEAITIIGSLLASSLNRYVAFLLELIQSMLLHERTDAPAPKQSKKPTYVAMASGCLDLLREIFEAPAGLQEPWKASQLQLLLSVMSDLMRTKYTNIPSDPDAPIWQNATATAVSIVEAMGKFKSPPATNITSDNLEAINNNIISCMTCILGQGGLEIQSPLPDATTLSSDETFDTTHFERLHKAALSLLSSRNSKSDQRKRYILTLFHASLVAKPWYFDLPSSEDLFTQPLTNLTTIRKGSVHRPSFAKRSRIPYAALDALFDLVSTASTHETEEAVLPSPEAENMAVAAAPYLLLRVAHPMKTFLADQPLRGLTPLPMKMQEELKWILERCVNTRVNDEAFHTGVAEALGHSDSGPQQKSGSVVDDGKSHLRFLFSLLLKLQKGWSGMMRLPDKRGWQDKEVGRAIEGAMEKWVESVGEGWGIGSLK